jgi:hypothetical protein
MFKRLRIFLDVMRGRFPGAIAIASYDDVSISTSSLGNVQVQIWINDDAKRNAAYQAISAWYAGKYY